MFFYNNNNNNNNNNDNKVLLINIKLKIIMIYENLQHILIIMITQ